jgi:DNA-binding PadR family transcriptional regulator
MSAKHVLLGFLLQRSSYPYELGDRLVQRLGPGWKVNSGQLSQELKRMEQDGLIEPLGGAGAGTHGPNDRHVFKATASGAEEFERWFAEETKVTSLSRRPLTAKLTLAGPARLSEALEQITAFQLECAKRLTELSRLHDSVDESVTLADPRVRADHVLLRVNLSADIYALQAELRWARHAHEMISMLAGCDAIWSSEAERAEAPVKDAHEDAREQLFGRMADEHEDRPR